MQENTQSQSRESEAEMKQEEERDRAQYRQDIELWRRKMPELEKQIAGLEKTTAPEDQKKLKSLKHELHVTTLQLEAGERDFGLTPAKKPLLTLIKPAGRGEENTADTLEIKRDGPSEAEDEAEIMARIHESIVVLEAKDREIAVFKERMRKKYPNAKLTPEQEKEIINKLWRAL